MKNLKFYIYYLNNNEISYKITPDYDAFLINSSEIEKNNKNMLIDVGFISMKEFVIQNILRKFNNSKLYTSVAFHLIVNELNEKKKFYKTNVGSIDIYSFNEIDSENVIINEYNSENSDSSLVNDNQEIRDIDEFSNRVKNFLISIGIYTLNDLRSININDLYSMDKIGDKSINEIKEFLRFNFGSPKELEKKKKKKRLLI